jgi:acetylornithine deacetylase/succinyl-diaminopimelate desuccinylase-like protein
MRPGLYAGVLAITLLGSPAAPQQPAVNPTARDAETLRHFRALVQIDTSNPPGNEVRIVEYLEKVLASDGIPSTRFALDPHRPNLVARLKGNGSKRPLLMLAHTDVVGVQREKWPVDPFGAILRDGYVWGRGTTDDKDNLTASLMTLLLIKRSGAALGRDLIFLAESGEEADPTGVGIRFMVDRHFDAIDAEFAIAEGNGATIEDGRVRTVQISTTEKVPRRVRLIATGTSGHGSVPRLDNAVTHLASAVQKIGTWETPMRLNETTRMYFEKLASISTPEQAARYRSLLGPQPSAAAERYLAEHEPVHYSALRTSLVPTMVQAGIGPNVIPSIAEAVIDIRIIAGRRPRLPHRADVRSHRRPRGQDRAVADHPSGRATFPDRLIDVPRTRAGRAASLSRVDGAPQHDERCDRHRAAPRQGRVVLRRRTGDDE